AAAGLDGDRRRGGRGVAARTAGRHQHRGPGGAGGAAPGGRRGARGRPGPFSRDARVSVPVGYLATVALVAWCTGFALAAPSRPRVLAVVAFWSGLLLNEQPFLALVWLSAATALVFAQGDVASPAAWAAVALAAATSVGLVLLARRGLRARPVLDRALAEGF